MSMITSADGASSIGGTSAALGGDADRAVFLHLRSMADGILVGAQTVRMETYSPLTGRRRLAIFSKTGELGANTSALLASPNTTIVNGDVREVCRSLDGDVWILEGGPSLNAQMLAADCVDEVCLTLAPRFAAGESPRIVFGEDAVHFAWSLAFIAHSDGFTFLRYVRERST